MSVCHEEDETLLMSVCCSKLVLPALNLLREEARYIVGWVKPPNEETERDIQKFDSVQKDEIK